MTDYAIAMTVIKAVDNDGLECIWCEQEPANEVKAQFYYRDPWDGERKMESCCLTCLVPVLRAELGETDQKIVVEVSADAAA